MRYSKLAVVVGIGLAGLAAGVGGWEPQAWGKDKPKEEAEQTPEEKQLITDWSRAQWYVREYQKAQNRMWTAPAPVSVMIVRAPEVITWCDTVEARRQFKTRTFTPEEMNGAMEFRLKDLLRQSRVYVQALVAMKEAISKEMPDRLAKAIAAADTDSEKGAQTGVTADFDKGRKSLDKAEDLCLLARAVYGKEDPALVKAEEDLKALEGRVAERQKQYWEKSKAKVKLPTEEYRAPDLEEIRTKVKDAWTAAYPKDKIVAVIVPSNAQLREMVVNFNETDRTIDLEEISILPVRVVVEGEGGVQWVYSGKALKVGRTASPTIVADVAGKEKLTSPTEMVVIAADRDRK